MLECCTSHVRGGAGLTKGYLLHVLSEGKLKNLAKGMSSGSLLKHLIHNFTCPSAQARAMIGHSSSYHALPKHSL